jgi:AcrR family transcriptional regulator
MAKKSAEIGIQTSSEPSKQRKTRFLKDSGPQNRPQGRRKKAKSRSDGKLRGSSHSSSGLSDLGARETLLQAAKKLFARKGLGGTSIRDIAQQAGVNSSLISYYFDGKDGLYRSCLEEIGESHLAMTQQILKPPRTKEEFRLRSHLFIENMFALYLNDRDTGLIIIREYDRVHSPAEEIFKQTFLRVFEQVIEFFRVAQKNKLVDPSKDPFTLASLFFGCLSSQMRLDHIKEKTYGKSVRDPKEMEKTIDHIVNLFN